MLLSLSVLGFFLSVILLYFNARKYPAAIYLGVFFLLVSLYGFNQYVVLYSKSIFLVSLFYMNIGFLSYLIGPMLYWYVRSVLTDDFLLKKNDLWHLLPMLIFCIAALPYLFSSWSHKMEIATKIVDDSNYLWMYKPTFLARQFLNYSIFLSRPILIFAYTIWSVIIFIRYKRLKSESKVFTHQHFMSKWLIVLFVFLTMWFVGNALQIAETHSIRSLDVFYTQNSLQFFSGVGLIGLLISPFFFPGILYGLPRVPEYTLMFDKQESAVGQPTLARKEGMLDFEADYLIQIDQNTEKCMKEMRPYLQPDCNLAYVSKLLDIPAHHLAYYFREERKQAFTDFRNEWRVNHAKELIKEGKTSELTLEAIGLLSGFSSRNAFFTAFKKVEEITPSAFSAQFIK